MHSITRNMIRQKPTLRTDTAKSPTTTVTGVGIPIIGVASRTTLHCIRTHSILRGTTLGTITLTVTASTAIIRITTATDIPALDTVRDVIHGNSATHVPTLCDERLPLTAAICTGLTHQIEPKHHV